MRRLRFLIALLAILCAPLSLRAQRVEREVQVALDPERGLEELDARAREELGLFPDVQGFESARLFRRTTGDFVLEIAYRDSSGALARERRSLGDAELAALRAEIQQALAAAGVERVVDRAGRAGLIVGQTLVGLGYHGWVWPNVLDFQDRGAVATYLLISGATFLLPYAITSAVPVSVPQRDAFFWGATRGIAYGMVAGAAVAPADDPNDFGDDETGERTRFALGSVGSVAGSLLGFQAAKRFDAPAGTVALWSAAGDFGLASAFGISYALGLFDEEVVFVECPMGAPCVGERRGSNRPGYALTFGLGAASLVGAKLWADAEDYTVGDARALRSFGALGAQVLLPVAVGLFDTADTDDRAEHLIAASAVVGAGAGLFVGNRALRRTSLSGGDGLLVLAGHVAGGLVALGLTYLLDGGSVDDIDDTVYLSTAAAGSAIGSLLTFRAVRRGPPSPPGTGSLPGRGRGLGAAEVTFHPEGAIPGLLGASRRGAGNRHLASPLVTLRF